VFCDIGAGSGASKIIGVSVGCSGLRFVATAIPATAGDCEFANDVSAAATADDVNATADDSERVLSATAG